MTNRRPRVYLAGPDVFLADAFAVGAEKKRICHELGLDGVFPLDELPDLAGLDADGVALAFFDICVSLMDSCEAGIANMTPFRGPSMDVGTALEMGYLFGQGKRVFGYSADSRTYVERVAVDGLTVEDFGQADNLMCPGVVHRSGSRVVISEDGATLAAMAAFSRCVRAAAADLSRTA